MLNQVQPFSQLPVVAGVEIPLDAEGRYNLNALHNASGEGQAKDPAHWLRNKQAQDFVSEVENQTLQICIVSIPGRNGGTFAHELAAVEYAGWISPKFRILVNQTFIDFRTGSLVAAPQTPKDPLLASVHIMLMEIDDAKQRIANLEKKTENVSNTLISAATILDNRTKRHEQILSRRDNSKKFNVTHVGRLLGLTAREVNSLMAECKLQERVVNTSGKNLGWRLLPAGQRYGRQNRPLYTARGEQCSASISWSEEVVDVLELAIP